MADYKLSTIASVLMLTERRVQQLAKEGVIVRSETRGKYDLVKSVQGYIKYLDEISKGRGSTLTAQQIAHFEKKNEILDLDIKREKGKLIDAKETERHLADLFTVIKTRIRAIAPMCAQEIARLKVSKKKVRTLTVAVEKILRKEHDAALEELSRWKQQ